jgi:hypothetical protein
MLWIENARRVWDAADLLSRRSCLSLSMHHRTEAHATERKTTHIPRAWFGQPHAFRQAAVCGWHPGDDPWLHIGCMCAHYSPNINLSDTPPGGFCVVARLIPGK